MNETMGFFKDAMKETPAVMKEYYIVAINCLIERQKIFIICSIIALCC